MYLYIFNDIKMSVRENIANLLEDLSYYDVKIIGSSIKNLTEVYEVKVTNKSCSICFKMHVDKHSRQFFGLTIPSSNYEEDSLLYGAKELELIFLDFIEKLDLAGNKEINEILDTIKCENGLCPICKSKVKIRITHSHNTYTCQNECYILITRPLKSNKVKSILDVIIFGSSIFEKGEEKPDIARMPMHLKINFIDRIYRQINYWKNGEKYLAKILSK
ncbi:gp451 [Bacillus phage G]|uniref:Gp451 n=1 Tax=Bacillus phage G TaxID=2884420 RepID=G3MAJ2_9CAUD|nr:gp451 [Bacillus phage G]AEO93709.1 gp451 [Bacillus phage G]